MPAKKIYIFLENLIKAAELQLTSSPHWEVPQFCSFCSVSLGVFCLLSFNSDDYLDFLLMLNLMNPDAFFCSSR